MSDLGPAVTTRIPAAMASALTLGAGLGVRAVGDGAFAKYAGIALYTLFVYSLIAFALPRLRPITVGATALAFSWGVELFQLTGIPADLSGNLLARLILGSTFNAPDLFWYAVGAACGWAVHSFGASRSSAVHD